MIVVACVSFDLWNEWWWAVGRLLGVFAIAAQLTVAPQVRKAKAAVTITADGAASSTRVLGGGALPAASHTDMSALEPQAPEALRASDSNNFNLLRHLFALMVVVYRAVLLPGVPGWERYESWTSTDAESLRWVLILSIHVAAEAWCFGLEHAGVSQNNSLLVERSRQLRGGISFFNVGMALAAWRDRVNWRSPWPGFGIALGLGLTAARLAASVPRQSDPTRFGNLFYGLYVAHFPIIQGVIAAGLFAGAVATGMAAGLCAALAAALLLWWLIERPALQRDTAYRNAC